MENERVMKHEEMRYLMMMMILERADPFDCGPILRDIREHEVVSNIGNKDNFSNNVCKNKRQKRNSTKEAE